MLLLAGVLAVAEVMSGADTNSEVNQLTRTLAGAYNNAIRHDAPTANLESEDLSLESASIRLSALIAHDIAGTCGSTVQHSVSSDGDCILDRQSGELSNLSDMLSYAASRLENQARMANPTQLALHRARLGSLEHLYRTVFTLAKAYFDRSQSEAYLKAAHEQINLAKAGLAQEYRLCSCNDPKYTTNLDELALIDNAILNIVSQH